MYIFSTVTWRSNHSSKSILVCSCFSPKSCFMPLGKLSNTDIEPHVPEFSMIFYTFDFVMGIFSLELKTNFSFRPLSHNTVKSHISISVLSVFQEGFLQHHWASWIHVYLAALAAACWINVLFWSFLFPPDWTLYNKGLVSNWSVMDMFKPSCLLYLGWCCYACSERGQENSESHAAEAATTER